MDCHGQSRLSHGTVGSHRILMADLDITHRLCSIKDTVSVSQAVLLNKMSASVMLLQGIVFVFNLLLWGCCRLHGHEDCKSLVSLTTCF